ncbi:MAG TPA: hypothetical protein VMR66_05515 [Gemmatimonadota bacterium]|nr:hypothetical protein [Gemmatimonadota bacterium]
MSEPIFPEACCFCGVEDDLVEDEHVEGLYTCRACLGRVAAQNERIRGGLEDEPDVEL